MNFPTNPPLTSAGVLLEAVPRLEGNVVDGKAHPAASYQFGQVFFMQYFGGKAGTMDHQHVIRQAGLFGKVLATAVVLCWQAGHGGEWQVIWCLRRHQMRHNV